MAFFPGQYTQAGGTWVDPSRMQTSQSGGSYIGGMTPQLPAQDMSFMWGGNGGTPAGGGMGGTGFSDAAIAGPIGGVADPNATAAAAWGSSGAPNYDQQINALYAGIGKTPDLIDQQGRDFWTSQLAAGKDISGAFQDSARTVYGNMLNGQPSPYEAQNRAGYANATSHPQGASGRPGPHSPDYGQSTGDPSLQSYQQSPFLAQMGEGLRNQFTGFMNDGLAANRGGAVATGGVGGSRQGIAEARTMTDAGKGFDSALANLYGQDYNNQMNRNLQKYQADQNFSLGNRGLDLGFQNSNNSYNLGLGSLDLQGRGQDQNFYTAQRAQDQSQYGLGLQGLALSQSGAWGPIGQMTNATQPWAGNGTTVLNGNTGGGALGALGGALGTAQLFNNMYKNSGSTGSWW